MVLQIMCKGRIAEKEDREVSSALEETAFA